MQIRVKCSCGEARCPEWAIVELQGDVEAQPSFEDRLQIGLLCRPSSPENYTFTVGYHDLMGAKMSLKKPILVLKKIELEEGGGDGDSKRVELDVIGVIRHKILFKTRPKALISRSLPQFTVEGYNTWSFRVESHLASIHDRMWEVITNGPIKIMKRSISSSPESPDTYAEKPRHEFTPADFKVDNLDRVARNVIRSTVSDAHVARIMKCKSAKEMWETLALLSRETEEIKENKLSILLRDFETLAMQSSESMEAFETRVLSLISTLATLGKDLSNKEINTNVCYALSGKWQIIKEICLFDKDLGAQSPEALFSDFKAMEFHLNKKKAVEEETNPPEKSLEFKAADESQADISNASSHDDIADMSREELEEFVLVLVRRFNSSNARAAKYKRFYKKQQGQQDRSQGRGGAESGNQGSSGVKFISKCFECHKVGHFKSECPWLSKREREEIKARQKTHKAYIAEDASEDQFTDDDDEEANQFSLDMGMLPLDEDEPTEFVMMAMSDAENVAGEVIVFKPKNSSITFAHVQCVANDPQENEDDIASHLDDDELLNDYLNLVCSDYVILDNLDHLL